MLILDSLGVGETLDAANYKDNGANTLAHIDEKCDLFIPNLKKIGFINTINMSENKDTEAFYTIAKPTIYKDFLKDQYNAGIKAKVIEHVLDDSYYRIFLQNKPLPIPPIRAKKRVFIYDRNFFKEGWQDIFDKISERKPSSIYCIHPIICKTLTDFISIRSFNKLARSNTIILDLNIPLDEVYYLLKSYKNLFLADIVKTTPVAIFLGGSFPTSFQYYKDFIYKMNLLYSFWSKGIELKIKYDYPKIGFNNPIENLEIAIESWTNGNGKYERTLEDKITKHLSKEQIQILDKEKQLLLKFHPEIKDLFTQNFNMLQKGGYWRI